MVASLVEGYLTLRVEEMGLDRWSFSSGSVYGASLGEALGFLDLRAGNRLERVSCSSLWAVSLVKVGGALAFLFSFLSFCHYLYL